jgi:hypothetical protein
MYRSRIDHDAIADTALFFYHVPKTGGVSFFTALRYAWLEGFRAAGDGPRPEMFRYDDSSRDRPVAGRHYTLVGSHKAFGAHLKFGQPFLLTTILRDPVARLTSEYTYQCMRRGQPVSAAGFEGVLRREDNTNRAVKQLGGHSRYGVAARPTTLEAALDILDRHFDSYVDHQWCDRLTEYYLSHYKLPNVEVDRLNSTTVPFKFDSTPYRDEIMERNRFDRDLAEHVRNHPRLPGLTSRSDALHPLTVIIRETGNDTRSEGVVRAVPTRETRGLCPISARLR